ncbi:MAG: methylenetetrahydrofolate reductase [Bdellovibrionota bacterium]
MVADISIQRSVIEILKSKPRTLSAEIIPPRNGAETEAVLKQIERLKTVPVDFISVTKGAGGSLRGGTLPIAQTIKSQFGICALAHFTCRDYTVEEVENNLMDHHYFGIGNILALRGDPPTGQPDHFKPAPNRHSYAWQLVDQICRMNQGRYLARGGYDTPVDSKEDSLRKVRRGTPTNFCIGVAAHPELEPHSDAVEFLRCKVERGASYAITQMLFSVDSYKRFLESCAARGIHIPIIPGIRIVTQASTAERLLSRKEFGVKIPANFLEKLQNARSKEDAKQIGLNHAFELCQGLFAAGAPGVHVFVMNDENTASDLLISLK